MARQSVPARSRRSPGAPRLKPTRPGVWAPVLHALHVNQGQRRSVLISAAARSRVVGRAQHSIGDDQVRRATGAESAQVASPRVVLKIDETRAAATEREQVFGSRLRAATVAARIGPLAPAAPGVGPGLLVAGKQIEGPVSLREDRRAAKHESPFAIPQEVTRLHAVGACRGRIVPEMFAVFAAHCYAGKQNVVFFAVGELGADAVARLPNNFSGCRFQGVDSGCSLGRLATACHDIECFRRRAIDAEDLAASRTDGEMSKTLLCRAGPEHLAIATVHHDQLFARCGRVVENLLRGAR